MAISFPTSATSGQLYDYNGVTYVWSDPVWAILNSASTSGTSGTSGIAGTSGTSGSSGTSGATGTAGTSGSSGTSGGPGADGTTPDWYFEGAFSTSNVYSVGSIVTYNGETWYNPGGGTNPPSSANGWNKLAAKGDAGTSGIAGTSGTSGSSGTSPSVSGSDNQILTSNGAGGINAESLLTFDGTKLSVLYQAGDEGGEILLNKAATNTTLAGDGITIDVYQNRIRFFEQGGSARGFYLDISAGGAGASTNLLTAGSGGTGGSGSSGSSGSSGTSGIAGTSGTSGTTPDSSNLFYYYNFY
jgi:collagen type VII alpha